MTSERRGFLPAGHSYGSSLPRHMTQPELNSSTTDSIGSNDSFQSQVPQPFYMMNEESHAAKTSYAVAINTRGGNDEGTDSKALVLGADSKSLNPKTKSYVPTGSTPTMSPGFSGQLPIGMGHGDSGLSQGRAAMQGYPQQSWGYGHGHHAISYQGAASFPPQYGPPIETAYPTSMPNPYAHFNIVNTVGSYNSHGQSSNNIYNNNTPHPNHDGYGYGLSSYDASGASNYAVQPPSQDSESGMKYSSDSQSAGGRSTGLSSVQGSTSGYNTPYHPHQNNFIHENRHRAHNTNKKHQNDSLICKNDSIEYPSNSLVDHKSENESNNGGWQLTNSNGSQNQHPAPDHDGRQSNNFHSTTNTGLISPVRPQSHNRNLSHGILPRYISPDMASEHGGAGQHHNRGESLDRTPQVLRSRRGQSVAICEQAKKTASWLESINPLNATNLHVITNQNSTLPPQPAKSFALTTIAGDDPFRTPMHQSTYHTQLGNLAMPTNTRPDAMSLYANDGYSAQYKILTAGGTTLPSVEEALLPNNLPFEEYCRTCGPDSHGVVKIRNIPYNVSRQEIMAFLGRNAHLVNENDNHEPVHIVMERVTSKTLDCYVEFINLNEAVNAVQRFEANRIVGKGGRLGQRHVDLELSSQDELMKELFPKAKNVKWTGGSPQIIETDPTDRYNSGFAGFISKEELVMLVKHVEAPQRSPFSKECPQRPFECLISTLIKYPWYAADYITIQDRNLLHDATKQLVSMLHQRVHNRQTERNDSMHINRMLLKRVWKACLACKGFTPTMKDDIVVLCELDETYTQELGVVPGAAEWCYLWTIGPKPGVPLDVLNMYITLIRDTTTRGKKQLSLAEQAVQGASLNNMFKLFGDLDKITEYPDDLSHRTLAQVAEAEWTAIEKALRQALIPAST